MFRSLILVVIIIITLTSCEKKKDIEDNLKSDDLRSVTQMTSNLPTVSDDMLCFLDSGHFSNYYIYLDTLCEWYDNNLIYFDIDSTLFDIENNYDGYSSLRQLYYTITEECEDPLTMINNDIIMDDILKSILNTNYEVSIGGDVYVFMNNDDIYRILGGDMSLVNSLRGIAKGEETVLIDLLKFDNLELISQKHDVKRVADDNYEDYIVPIMMFSNIDCERYEKSFFCTLEYIGNCSIDDWDVTWTIDFGDNSPTVTNTTNSFSGSHIYPDGSYTATVTVRYEDYNNSGDYIEDTKTFSIETDIACSNKLKSDSDNPDNGKYMMTCLLYYRSGNGAFWPSSRVRAKTMGWYWKSSSAKWKRKRYNSYVEMDFVLRESDNSCGIFDSDNKQKGYKKRRKIRVSRFAGNHRLSISNTENNSYHSVQFPDGTSLTANLELNPCN